MGLNNHELLKKLITLSQSGTKQGTGPFVRVIVEIECDNLVISLQKSRKVISKKLVDEFGSH